MSSMTVAAGLQELGSSGRVEVIHNAIVDSIIKQYAASVPSLRHVRCVAHRFEVLGNSIRITLSLERKPTSPGACGCKEKKSGIARRRFPGTRLAANP